MSNVKYFCIPALAGSATATSEVTNTGGYLKFTGASLAALPDAMKNFPIQLNGVKNGVYKAYAAEALRVITITPTAAANADYRVVLSAEKGQDEFDNNLPNEVQTTFTHTAPATGATATTIANAFRTAINSHPYWSERVVASGTTTLVITAKAGYPIFSAGVGPLMAAAVTTAGSPEYGEKGAALLATENFTAAQGLPVSGTNYGVISFEVRPEGGAVLSAGASERYEIYLVGGSNNAGMITALQALLVK